ncbi:hypothetical protein OSTOST_07795 [Ostertagia ostertagi]
MLFALLSSVLLVGNVWAAVDQNCTIYDGNDLKDPQLVQAAVDLCPKTCGYCCLTPAFSCNDKLRILNLNTRTFRAKDTMLVSYEDNVRK